MHKQAAYAGDNTLSQSSTQNPLKTTSVAVFGARGYSGLELARICLKNQNIQLKAVLATESNWKLSDYLPEARALEKSGKAVSVLTFKEFEKLTDVKIDVAFLATPAEASLELAPKLLAQGIHVIDLSGAFRLKKNDYAKWYGHAHTAPKELINAVYGLSPWSEIPLASKSSSAVLISNPGCYATSVLMALAPLLKDGLIDPSTIVIDAKSGTSGAGKKAAENLLFTEVEGECLPYRVGKHQHTPEITETIESICGVSVDPSFATHLLATRRGIISSIYAKPSTNTAGLSKSDVTKLFTNTYDKYYGDYPLAVYGEATPGLMSLKSVVGSARVQISYTVEGNHIYIFSVIDNLLKGAASQAFENLNRLIGLKPENNLTSIEGVL